jgi:GT2 family glycosyltransferase
LFSIILPIYDPHDRFVTSGAVQAALARLGTLRGHYELIIVNNNEPNSSPILTSYLRQLKIPRTSLIVVEAGSNAGTARGFNLGMERASAESKYLVFMSHDADVVDPDLLLRIDTAMNAHPHVGVAHPMSVYEDAEPFNWSRLYSAATFRNVIRKRVSVEEAEVSEADLRDILRGVSQQRGVRTKLLRHVPLTFAVIRREVVRRIGGFDEGCRLGCGENNDFCYRTLQAGFTIGRINSAFVNHRRYYFRCLVGAEHPEGISPLAINQANEWWHTKYGRPYIEVYYRFLLGAYLFTLVSPLFYARRVAGSMLRALGKR